MIKVMVNIVFFSGCMIIRFLMLNLYLLKMYLIYFDGFDLLVL